MKRDETSLFRQSDRTGSAEASAPRALENPDRRSAGSWRSSELGRRYLPGYAAGSVTCLVLIGLFNWLVDPLQFYHRAFLHSTFVDNQRYQNPGLIKHTDYDAVIIGTSHTENFLPSRVRSVLGWEALKLSVSGSSVREQSLNVGKALATGQVRHVLWGLDFNSFDCAPDEIRKAEDGFPMHLYRETVWTPLKYLLSFDTLWFSLRALSGRGEKDLERLNTWHDEFVFSEQRVLEAWKQRRNLPEFRFDTLGGGRAETDPRAISAGIRKYLVAAVQAHPECTFHFVFSPYSMLTYLDDFTRSPDRFSRRTRFKREVAAALIEFPNCRIYDLQSATEITHNLNNFKDLEHYSLDVNDFILESLLRGDYLLTPENWRRHLANFEDDAYNFAISAFDPASELYAKLDLACETIVLPERRTASNRALKRGGRSDAHSR